MDFGGYPVSQDFGKGLALGRVVERLAQRILRD